MHDFQFFNRPELEKIVALEEALETRRKDQLATIKDLRKREKEAVAQGGEDDSVPQTLEQVMRRPARPSAFAPHASARAGGRGRSAPRRSAAWVLNASKSAISPGFTGGTRVTGSKPSGSVGPLECGQQPRANGCHRASWE